MPRVYHTPTKTNTDELKAQAARRRQALIAGGCSTYALGIRNDRSAIQCLCCGLGSLHPRDIRERYCGFCHAFHTEWQGDPAGSQS